MAAQTEQGFDAVPLSIVTAANIRAEAARRGLTQTKLAGLLEMSHQAVSDRYRGRTPWSVDELEQVAQLFGTNVPALLARPEGFEPPTFWFGAGGGGAVVDLSAARAVRARAAA